MMRMMTGNLGLAAMLAMAPVTADAATFAFHYKSTVNTISGKLTGTLLADGNTVEVATVADFVRIRPGSASGGALPYVLVSDEIYGGAPHPAKVSFDGSFMELFACSTEYCDFGTDGIAFDTTLALDVFGFYAADGAFAGPIAGGFREEFVAGNWSLAAVPEPSTWAMLIAGFGLVGAMARQRRFAGA